MASGQKPLSLIDSAVLYVTTFGEANRAVVPRLALTYNEC
jgi:hypothetical protein